MSQLLSPEWFEEVGAALAEFSAAGAVSVRINYVLSGAPDGKVTCHLVLVDGVVDSLAPGKITEPDIVVSLSFAEAITIATGLKSAHSSFMTGGLKVEGEHALWLLELQPFRHATLATLQSLTDPAG